MNRGRKEFAFFSLGRLARPGGIMVRLRQRVQRRAQRPFKRRDGASLRSIGPIRKAVNERPLWRPLPHRAYVRLPAFLRRTKLIGKGSSGSI